jgi:hypothetical protein
MKTLYGSLQLGDRFTYDGSGDAFVVYEVDVFNRYRYCRNENNPNDKRALYDGITVNKL